MAVTMTKHSPKSVAYGQRSNRMNRIVVASLYIATVLQSLQKCHAFTVRPQLAPPRIEILTGPPSFASAFDKKKKRLSRYLSWNSDNNEGNSDEMEDFDPVELPDDRETALSSEDLDGMTVPQLKQQLRLRNLKLSGNKSDLKKRLLRKSGTYVPEDDTEERFVDVSEYLDPNDVGAATKSVSIGEKQQKQEVDNADNEESRYTEVWGAQARIVDDYEGRGIVVDGISRTVVEFTGSNKTTVRAFVAASRDALRPFLQKSNKTDITSVEQRLYEIQSRREEAVKRPWELEDDLGLDEGDETGIYKDVLHRDYSDWGKYTPTGAQLSSQEVEGVLLLSDVYGMENNDTQALAEKIAFECQPVVVMVPDLFRGKPWKGPTDQLNEDGLTYEQWRSLHGDLRVSVDIRAAAACLRERYRVSSVVVWGTCFGGGRALEAAGGWLPDDNIHDVDGSVGPPLVNPMAVIAWYPTRYNVKNLFGKSRSSCAYNQGTPKMAVMSIFAGKDTISGATKADAAKLKALLGDDDRVLDYMVKVFPEQDHGFAHRGLCTPYVSDPYERFVDEEFGGAGRLNVGRGDAEVACLLSTAFMETYSRVFLPTTGPPISLNDNEKQWADDLEMKSLEFANKRDIRREIEESLESFGKPPSSGIEIDPSDESYDTALRTDPFR